MNKKNNMEFVGKLLILVTTVIWGSSFFILKNTIDLLPPMLVIAIRFSLSAIIMILIFFKKIIKINKKVLIKGTLIGLTLAAAYLFQTLGLERTSPAKNAFLTATYCVLVPFLAWIINKKKPTFLNIAASIVCFVGIGLVSLDGNFKLGLGDGLTLISSLFFGLQIVLISKYVGGEDAVQLLFVQFLVCAVLFWLISLTMELPDYPSNISLETVGALLYLAIVATALAQMFQILGQRYVSSGKASLIFSLEAVFGTIFSALFYHEIITAKMYAGFILIFIALIVSSEFFRDKQHSALKN